VNTNHFDLNHITHVVPDFGTLKAWCESHQTSPEVGYTLLQHVDDLAEAERVWQHPTPMIRERITLEAVALAAERGEDGPLFWGGTPIPMPWEEESDEVEDGPVTEL
jgi:hypothetical protein